MIKLPRKPRRVNKAWGWEDIIVNNDRYCAKILHFKEGARFSLHFHLVKHETWYVAKGSFIMTYVDTDYGNQVHIVLRLGDVIEIPQGLPHQLRTLEESEIFEASTPHLDVDSYRIEPGDSQKKNNQEGL